MCLIPIVTTCNDFRGVLKRAKIIPPANKVNPMKLLLFRHVYEYMHIHNNDRKNRKPNSKRKYFNQLTIDIAIDRTPIESIKLGY